MPTLLPTLPSRHTARALALVATLAGLASLAPTAVRAQEPFLGEIRCFGFNFAPRGWALAQGQILSIAQNTALFSLLGTQYGGNGQTTFALPDLRGRSMVGTGLGPGLGNVSIGQVLGAESINLSVAQLPPHNHSVAPLASQNDASSVSPSGKVPASKARTTLYTDPVSTTTLAASPSSSTGSGQPVPIRSPGLGISCAIALEGIFPSRD